MRFRQYFIFLLLITLSSCAYPRQPVPGNERLAYVLDDASSRLAQFAPVFVVENSEKLYNRIGTPRAFLGKNGLAGVNVDPEQPSIYAEQRSFVTDRASYTNLVYRIHFKEVPATLVPFQLSAGKNVGLFVIVTLNDAGRPVLYSTVHTCGCYLAFVPTSFLPRESYPEGWPNDKQVVYGETLPVFLNLSGASDFYQEKIVIALRDGSHRVMGVALRGVGMFKSFNVEKMKLYSLGSLERLPLNSGGLVSFFEETGSRRGYVKNTSKPRERLLMSWWAFDWRVGEDKKLGQGKNEPPVFYTSLKPWARDKSDLRDFKTFLEYWGWRL